MELPKNVELRNLAIDIVITLLAINLLDISGFVGQSLPYAVYILVPVQSFSFFLMYADTGLEDIKKESGFYGKIRFYFSLLARASAMFYWVLGVAWVFLVLDYLELQTGIGFRWAGIIAILTGVLMGIIVLVRMFANIDSVGGESVELSYIRSRRSRPWSEQRWGEIIILPVYEKIIYGNIGAEKSRAWFGWIITFAFLIYTETLYEIMFYSDQVSKPLLLASIIFSFFPVRLVLLTRPPFSLYEAASALISSAIFIYMLFAG